MKLFGKAFFIVLSGLLVAGCAAVGNEVSSKTTLKVMYWDESSFFASYGDLFALEHPEVEVEVAGMAALHQSGVTDETLKALINREQPDVLVLEIGNYETMAAKGELAELSPLIERDQYDIETMYPGLISMLKAKGGGKLYGLTPGFDTDVIFYNADLFAKYGVELPHDGMTWQDIMNTARRFPAEGQGEDRIYGFALGHASSFDELAMLIGSSQGLTMNRPETGELTLNSDGWKQAYRIALDGIESGAVFDVENEGAFSEDHYSGGPFLVGRAAMTTGGSYIFQYMKNAETNEAYKPFKAGAVAGPVNLAEPDKTDDMEVRSIFAIRDGSPNADTAWEFIKFANGEKLAKVKAKTLSNGLPARMGVVKEYEGVNLDVFYKLEPRSRSSVVMSGMPPGFNEQYQRLLSRELDLVRKGSKTIDDALDTVQAEAQAAWDLARKVQEEEDGKSSGR